MVQAGEQSWPETMSNQIPRPAESHLISRLQQRNLSTEAQPPNTADELEQAAQGGGGESRRTFSTHLRQLDVARTTDEDYRAVRKVPEEGEMGPSYDTAHKLQSRSISRRLSIQSEGMITSKIEQLELAQLNSPQLRELVTRLKRLYSIKTPKLENTITARNPYSEFRVGERWQELQGCSRWDDLLDPIDPVLKAEVVRYGEFAQVAYDAFDRDKTSRYCGSCKYTKEQLLERCGLENRGYEITQYLYATADLHLPTFFTKSSRDDKWSKDSNWIGFVAVCTSPAEIARLGRRDILVAWRGTITRLEWIKDIQDITVPAGFDPRNGHKDVMVESGFLSVYKSSNSKSRYNKKSAREQVLDAVRDLVEKYKHEKETQLSITVTGHSLGSAVATLCGYDIAESQLNLLSGISPSVPNSWNSRKADWEATSTSFYSEGSDSLNSASSSASYSGFSTTSVSDLDSSSATSASSAAFHSGFSTTSVSKSDSGSATSASSLSSSTISTSNGGSATFKSAANTSSSFAGPAMADSNVNKSSCKLFRSDRIPVTVYSFAGPKVGNQAFKTRMEELGVVVLRVANEHDWVPKLPGKFLRRFMKAVHHVIPVVPSYIHVGVELRINNTASPFLQDPENLAHAHCLEAYLHGVDGFHGKNLPFKPTMRDYALVNKGGDLLKREFFIPARWWQEAYKGLVKDEDGHWILPARDDEIWPATPIESEEIEVKKDEQFKEFWRNVSIAYQRSSPTSNVVSLAALDFDAPFPDSDSDSDAPFSSVSSS